MVSRTMLGIAAALAGSLMLLSAAACATVATPAAPPPAPTPTDEEREVQTPTEFGGNTRVVDGDIHVWYAPSCPPVPPGEWVAPIILTEMRSGSHLYLNRNGWVRSSPKPDYRSEEGRQRFEEVLADDALMEQVLTFPECP